MLFDIGNLWVLMCVELCGDYVCMVMWDIVGELLYGGVVC